MADRLLTGRLEELLLTYRAEGMTWDQIARQLYIDGGVEVTPETLRSWFGQLGAEAAEESA